MHTCVFNKLQSYYNYVIQNKTINSCSDRDALKLPQHMCVGSSAFAVADGNPEKAKYPCGRKSRNWNNERREGISPAAHTWPAVCAPVSYSS